MVLDDVNIIDACPWWQRKQEMGDMTYEHHQQARKLLEQFEQRLMKRVNEEIEKASVDLMLQGHATISILYAETLRVEVPQLCEHGKGMNAYCAPCGRIHNV